jgi:hypothetical protein
VASAAHRLDIDHSNQNPTPFVWTNEQAEIIRKRLRRAR